MLENRKKLTDLEYQELLLKNASKYAARVPEPELITSVHSKALAEHEAL
jgi:hypothetical protein